MCIKFKHKLNYQVVLEAGRWLPLGVDSYRKGTQGVYGLAETFFSLIWVLVSYVGDLGSLASVIIE